MPDMVTVVAFRTPSNSAIFVSAASIFTANNELVFPTALLNVVSPAPFTFRVPSPASHPSIVPVTA